MHAPNKEFVFKLSSIIIIIMLTTSGTNSQQQRLDEMANVCSGQDLVHVIARACSIFKRSPSEPEDIPYPRSIPLKDIALVCCKMPCRMSLFFRLCS